MTYINISRIKKLCHCGEVNIPFGTEFDVDDQGFLYTYINDEKKQICLETSETAYKYFAYNVDGCGEERKDLIKQSVDVMGHIDKSVAFCGLLSDPIFMKYKKHPLDDSEWSWDRLKVHKAPISDLKYMLTVFKSMPKLIGPRRDDRPVVDLRYVRYKGLR